MSTVKKKKHIYTVMYLLYYHMHVHMIYMYICNILYVLEYFRMWRATVITIVSTFIPSFSLLILWHVFDILIHVSRRNNLIKKI